MPPLVALASITFRATRLGFAIRMPLADILTEVTVFG
jgi:hypothetical protein